MTARDTVADILARHGIRHEVTAKGVRALAPTPLMLACREAYDEAGQQAALETAARLAPDAPAAYCSACESETYTDAGACLVCWTMCQGAAS